jgi:hypothetical protein
MEIKMNKDQCEKIFTHANSTRKEQIRSQLERLNFLEIRGVIKYHEIAQKEKLERELVEIEYSEKRSSSNPPAA